MANETGKESKVEIIKREGDHLRGTISEELANDKAYFSDESYQLLKFHGIYQQDDRDVRRKLRQEGKDKYHIMMVRARIPGGVLTPEQYLAFDDITDRYGGGTLRVTTRQTLQLHYILKSNIKAAIRSMNEALVTTLNGCGDQARNTIGCAEPIDDGMHREIRDDLLALAQTVGAKTNAYHEIWMDGEKVPLEDHAEEEPLYGETYLPRKFKIGFAIAGDNCVDVYANDLGVVAHGTADHVEGYTILAGGGMGRTATIKTTYARLATPIAYVPRDELTAIAVAVLSTFRDFGNRSDRRHARLKYLLDSRGLDWFKAELAARLGHALTPPRDLDWENGHDHLGWHRQGDGRWYLGLFVENGRVKDAPGFSLKSALRRIVERWRPTVHFTSQQNVLLAGFDPTVRVAVEDVLKAAGVKLPGEISNTRLHSMACVGLPTCGLATADSERALPDLLPQFEALFDRLGLEDEAISIRMTGCANGCARPYIADIGLVGRTPGKYDLHLGGDFLGRRLNRVYKELVPIERIVGEVSPIVEAFARERNPRERFGDFCERVGLERFAQAEAK